MPQLSDKVLTERLKELESLEIIKRNVYAETPVRIEYTLTEKGIAFKKVLSEVQIWATTWL